MVKKPYDRVIAMNLGPATPLADVDSVNVVDDATVQIVLKEPHACFMAYLPKIGIVSPTAWESNQTNGDYAAAYLEQHTAGTGPYTLTELRPNERKVMERFPDYWQGWDGPHLERIVFSAVPQMATKRQMLEASEVHYVGSLPAEVLAALKTNPAVRVVVAENFEIDIIPLNTQKAPSTTRASAVPWPSPSTMRGTGTASSPATAGSRPVRSPPATRPSTRTCRRCSRTSARPRP